MSLEHVCSNEQDSGSKEKTRRTDISCILEHQILLGIKEYTIIRNVKI